MKTIQETAETFEVSTRTLRYYEEIGLLEPDRSSGNQRKYSKADETRLKLILRGKKYGFSLDEIREMVLLFDEDRSGKKQLERTIEYGEARVREIEASIKEFQALKQEMEDLLEGFKQKLKEEKE
ncbi:MerR family transcriptional regulator [Salimicrobium flavidum]|uniref:DNA-binding transcriptional regulator, MerR family n=1 Tax=Salimicrobium flavidum TaxID=570947 RepID=A0A1N7J655_9BACI|nr:MerR family transcriptional regulator [Salimicrobium flavidum]SIS44843.1 DNA-binding transcriptional regulator, MerR family [Salimicrobium flavidum]